MYAAATTLGSGTTPARVASTAARLGYEGIVVGVDREEADRIAEAFEIDVCTSSVIRPDDRNAAAGEIDRARDAAEIVVASAKDEGMLRFLAERERIDVLSAAGPLRHTIAKTAAANGIAIGIDLGPVLRAGGERRADAMQGTRQLTRMLEGLDLPITVTTGAESHLHLRAPRELVAVGVRCGMDREAIESGLKRWGALARRSRRARDDRFIEPGVRVVDDDSDDR